MTDIGRINARNISPRRPPNGRESRKPVQTPASAEVTLTGPVTPQSWKEQVKSRVLEYLSASNPQTAYQMEVELNNLLALAGNYGIGQEEIENLLTPLKPQRRERSLTMEEIHSKRIFVISPEDLPPEVQNILEAGGHWDNVLRIRRLIITPGREIFFPGNWSGGRLSYEVRGMASFGGIVKAANYDMYLNSPICPQVFAMILVHEASHYKRFLEFYNNPEELI